MIDLTGISILYYTILITGFHECISERPLLSGYYQTQNDMLCTNKRIPRKLLISMSDEGAFTLIKQFLNEYSYGTTDENEYELFHKSIRTWLTTSAAERYKISETDIQAQHQIIASLCGTILQDPCTTLRLQEYARKNIIFHLLYSKEGPGYLPALELFLSPSTCFLLMRA